MNMRQRPATHRAWLVVAGLAVTFGVVLGVAINAFSVLQPAIIRHFGISTTEAAASSSAFLLCLTLCMPVAGWLTEKYPPQPVLLVGSLITGGGYWLAAHSPSLSAFTWSFAACGVGVSLCTYIPAVALISRTLPPQQQGMAVGCLLGAASAGGMVLPPLLTHSVSTWGLPATLEAAAAAVLLVCAPLLLLTLPRWRPSQTEEAGPAPQATGASRRTVLAQSGYWWWIGLLGLSNLSGISVLIALVSYLMAAGFSATDAAWVYAGTSAATLAGSLGFGALCTRWGPRRTMQAGLALAAFGTLLLLPASTGPGGLACVVLFAVVWGSTFNLSNQLSPELLLQQTGHRHFASLLGVGNLLAGLGSALGPMAFGQLQDLTHHYTAPLMVCAWLMVMAMFCVRRLPQPKPPTLSTTH